MIASLNRESPSVKTAANTVSAVKNAKWRTAVNDLIDPDLRRPAALERRP